MAVFTIEDIKSRRSRKGRVEYYVKWTGYPDSDNTWETRMDLIRDGHQRAIQRFERARKSSSKSSGDESSRRSSVSRSRSRSQSKSQNPSRRSRSTSTRARSRSIKSDTTRRRRSQARVVSPSPNSATSPLKSATSPLNSATLPLQSATSPLNSAPPTGATSAVSHYLETLGHRGWLRRSMWIVLVFLLLIAHSVLPVLNQFETEIDPVVIQILSSVTALVPLLLLLLTLSLHSTSSLTKSVEIALCWRTAGELILRLPLLDASLSVVYTSGAYGALGFSNFCLLYGLSGLLTSSSSLGRNEPCAQDPLTQALGVLGVLGTFASDAILFVQLFEDARVTLMGLSLLFLTLSNVLQVDQVREG